VRRPPKAAASAPPTSARHSTPPGDVYARLTARQETRRQQFRFRKDPAAYLAALEAQLLKPPLPS